MIDRAGATWTRSYDAKGNLTRLTDPLGRSAVYEYDARDRLTRQTLPGESRAFSYGYDAVGNRTSESKPSGQNLTHSYDDLNRLLSSADQLGTIAQFEFDADGNPVRYLDGRLSEVTASYNGLSQKESEVRPLGRNLSWTWSVHGEVLTETDGRGHTISHVYDSLGRRTESTDPIGTRSWDLDNAGNVLSETDRLGRTTSYTYDNLDRRITQTDPAPPATSQSWTYSAVDEVLSHTDRRGIVSQWTYDGDGRVLTETRAGISMAINDYDAAGQRTSLTDALGRITSFEYDNAGRWIRETGPDNAVRTRTWWPTDDPQSETDADGITVRWTYDVRRRLENESNALDEVTAHQYDNNGNRTSTTRPLQNAWIYEFDLANRLAAVVDPLSHRTEYDYDQTDNRTRLRDANSHERTWDYDELNRPTKMTFPDGAEEITTLDAEGNPTLTVRANGQRIERDFDGLNRLIEERFDPVNEDRIEKINYQYDGNGNPTLITETLSDGVRSSTLRYDDFDRLLEMTDRNGRTVSYAYDLVGNRTERTGPEGRTDYAYNDRNQLTAVTPPRGQTIVITPTPAGRWNRIDHPNGVRTEVTQDPVGRTSAVRHWLGAAAVLLASYSFDANGNRAVETIESATQSWQTSYEHDAADRLSGYSAPEGNLSYTLDPVGNRTTEDRDGAIQTHSYDNRDRLTETHNGAGVLIASYQYDPAGRQISQSIGGTITHYGYSARDRLTSIRHGSAQASPIVEYEYDHAGQRSRISQGSREDYQWDGHDLAARTNAVGNVLGSYTNANGWTLSSLEGGERNHYHLDALGTPLAITDGQAAVAVRYRVDPWGQQLEQSNPHPNPVGFTGYIKDGETEQLYAQARQYLPGGGRFSTVDEWEGDPLRPLSLNVYLYGFGNPGVYVDPTGRYAEGGHYYTVFIAAKYAGYNTERSLRIALYAQLPDEIATLDAINQQYNTLASSNGYYKYTARDGFSSDQTYVSGREYDRTWVPNEFSRDETQRGIHQLNGGNSIAVTNLSRAALVRAESDELAGISAHAFGDSYSHRVIGKEGRMYPTGRGHALHGTRPDMITERPELYQEYVKDLVTTLAARRGGNVSEEEADALARSLASLADAPIASAEAAIRRSESSGKRTTSRGYAMSSAEARVTAALRARAGSLISESERDQGVVLLSPEKAGTGYFAGTSLSEQDQLNEFWRKSLPRHSGGSSNQERNELYSQDMQWDSVRSFFTRYLWGDRTCEMGSCSQ